MYTGPEYPRGVSPPVLLSSHELAEGSHSLDNTWYGHGWHIGAEHCGRVQRTEVCVDLGPVELWEVLRVSPGIRGARTTGLL